MALHLRISPRIDIKHVSCLRLDQMLLAPEFNDHSIAQLIKLITHFLMNRVNHRFQLVTLNEPNKQDNEFHEQPVKLISTTKHIF